MALARDVHWHRIQAGYRREASAHDVGKLAAATNGGHLTLVGSIAELERGNGIVEGIDPVLVSRFRMVAHISDELRCDLSGGELQDTPYL